MNRNLSADQFSYEPRSYTDVSWIKDHNDKPMVMPLHYTNPATGFDEARHEIAATHPEHGTVGTAKWTDRGNITVEVKDEFRRKGIGMRLVDEAHKYKPDSALEGLTPVSHAGYALTEAVERKYGVKRP